MERPTDLDTYEKWLKEELRCKIDAKVKRRYETVSLLVRSEFEQTDFWKCLKHELEESEAAYRLKTNGYSLLMTKPGELDLDIKGFDSFFLKTGRWNAFENKNWPSAPDGGWVTPENWFSKINDIVRTMVVVKYLDGVEILVERLQQLCNIPVLTTNVDWEAREEGYYAAHLYVEREYSIPTLDFNSEKIPIKVEIQVTTQLQEAINRLTHKYYEERRRKVKSSDSKWQWDYESDEFIPNYLGHILHYVEGMIMEVRNREVKK
ncbi:MAG: hypothetical protein HY670_11055 [Chloroflexi bacterium]|nr:hypothetical protein [Chloroflexota bacterium]